jgi:hypothetical protein
LAGETLSDPFWGKEFNRYRELDIMEGKFLRHALLQKCKNLLAGLAALFEKVYIFKL